MATDRLQFGLADLASLVAELKPTKPNLVSIVGRFGDPMGFLSLIVIGLNIFFQGFVNQCKTGTSCSLNMLAQVEHTYL